MSISEEKKKILETFNNHFCEMVDDFHRIFPNDTTISIMNKSLSILMMMSKKQVIQVFKTSTVDLYSKKIEDGDLSFFIDKNYKDDVSNSGYSTDVVLEKIEYIKGLVKEMTEHEQNNVIKYFQNLTLLCKMYYDDE
jgi:hypothetical protein